MIITAAIVAVSIFASLSLAVRQFRRRDPERDLNRQFAQTLRPFAGFHPSARYKDKNELWTAIGKLRGAWKLWKGAAAINELACRIARDCPEARTAADMISAAMRELHLVALLLPLEALHCRYFPEAPRALAGTMVRLYCDIASMLEAAESIAST